MLQGFGFPDRSIHPARDARVLFMLAFAGILLVTLSLFACGQQGAGGKPVHGATVNAGSHSAELLLPTVDSYWRITTVRARTSADSEEAFRALGRAIAQTWGLDPGDRGGGVVVHFYHPDAPPAPSEAMADGTLGAEYERWITGRYTHTGTIREQVSALPFPSVDTGETVSIGEVTVREVVAPSAGAMAGGADGALLHYVVIVDDASDPAVRSAIGDHYAWKHPESLQLRVGLVPSAARWDGYPEARPTMYEHLAGSLERFRDGAMEWKPR
ncbi:MAG: hypothetical protein ACTS3F_00770 [Phycisphaerales bacterium]